MYEPEVDVHWDEATILKEAHDEVDSLGYRTKPV
jgi:hypothetical protein